MRREQSLITSKTIANVFKNLYCLMGQHLFSKIWPCLLEEPVVYIYMFAWETCVFMKQHVFKEWTDHLGERIVHQFNNSVQNLVVWWNSKRYQKSYIYTYIYLCIYTLMLWLYEIYTTVSYKNHGFLQRHGFIQQQKTW